MLMQRLAFVPPILHAFGYVNVSVAAKISFRQLLDNREIVMQKVLCCVDGRPDRV